MMVVDGDPNNDGDPNDAKIAGTVLLTGTFDSSGNAQFANDDNMTSSNVNLNGMGGQGVYAIPNVYPGWVQLLDFNFASQLTDEQRDPTGTFNALKNQPINNQVNNTNLVTNLKHLTLEDKIGEKVEAQTQVSDQENPKVLDIQNEGSSLELIKPNSIEKPYLNSDQPNRILAMLPIPYP
jgi:hypothetical protein